MAARLQLANLLRSPSLYSLCSDSTENSKWKNLIRIIRVRLIRGDRVDFALTIMRFILVERDSRLGMSGYSEFVFLSYRCGTSAKTKWEGKVRRFFFLKMNHKGSIKNKNCVISWDCACGAAVLRQASFSAERCELDPEFS
jgi:hypothetical protein